MGDTIAHCGGASVSSLVVAAVVVVVVVVVVVAVVVAGFGSCPLSLSLSPPRTIPLRSANALSRSCATLFDTPTSGSSSVSSVSDNSCPTGGPRGRYLVPVLPLVVLPVPFAFVVAVAVVGVAVTVPRGKNEVNPNAAPCINSPVATLPTSRVDATGSATALFVCVIIGARIVMLLRMLALLDVVGASAALRRRTGGSRGATGGG